MRTVVLDASVVAKWFLPGRDESLVAEALETLRRYSSGEIHVVVPDLFWAEMGSVLWKAGRSSRVTGSAIQNALSILRELRFTSFPIKPMLDSAFAIAAKFNCSVYDSLYVAAAISSDTELITADEKLANALAARLPVKWLGAYF